MSLGYDPLGRMQTSTAWGVTTNFLYAGAALVAEYDNSGSILRRYVPGPGLDEPTVWYEGAGTSARRWLHADDLGSIVAWSDTSGNPQAAWGYGPYGEQGGWSGPRWRYTGQLIIPEAQLYYYKSRFYSPIIGRFLQTDPIGYADGPNWYGYGHGDPINLTDPSGLDGELPPEVSELVVTAPGNIIGGSNSTIDYAAINASLVAAAQRGAAAARQFLFPRYSGICLAFGGRADCASGNFGGTAEAQGQYLGVLAGVPAAGLGLGAAGASLASTVAAEAANVGTTTLFRAVSHAEYADIMESGAFQPGAGSYETGKFFAESGADATEWGNAMEGVGNFKVVQGEFPNSAADQFTRFDRLDGIGPARFGTYDQLGQPSISLWPGSP